MPRVLCLIALAALAALLTACGGSDPAPPGSAANPLPASTPAAVTSEGKPLKPGYNALVQRQKSGKPGHRFSPCTLVTKAQARAILGAAMADPVEAPQGPTCIYRSKRGDQFVTLAMQETQLSKLRRSLKGDRAVKVAKRTAYCGTYGQPMLYLPVSNGRVLTVTAPCKVASGFAATAARRLAG
jgi:Protein of unknown function (DUF3558)